MDFNPIWYFKISHCDDQNTTIMGMEHCSPLLFFFEFKNLKLSRMAHARGNYGNIINDDQFSRHCETQ